MSEKCFNRIRNLKNQINFNSRSGNKENMLCINRNESEEHLNKKFEVCKQLIKEGSTFYTKSILTNNKRADIIGWTKEGNGFIIEIVNTESNNSINNKLNNYPIDLDFRIEKLNK